MQLVVDVIELAPASASFRPMINRITIVVNLTRASVQIHDLRRDPEFVAIDRSSVGRHLTVPSSTGTTYWLDRFEVEAELLQPPDHESSNLNLVTQQRMTFRNAIDHNGLTFLVDLLG